MNDQIYDSEEDSFFEPPKLSSYSMALLNNNSSEGGNEVVLEQEKYGDADGKQVDNDADENSGSLASDHYKSYSATRYEDAMVSLNYSNGNINSDIPIVKNNSNPSALHSGKSSILDHENNSKITPSPIIDRYVQGNSSKSMNNSIIPSTDENHRSKPSSVENNNNNYNLIPRNQLYNGVENNNDLKSANADILISTTINNSNSGIYRRSGISSRIPSIPLGQPRRISGTSRKSEEQQQQLSKDNHNQYANQPSISTTTTTYGSSTNNGSLPGDWNLNTYGTSINGKTSLINEKENNRNGSISPHLNPEVDNIQPPKVLNAYKRQNRYSGNDGSNSSEKKKSEEDIMYEKLRDIRSKQERLSFEERREQIQNENDVLNINSLRQIKRSKNFESYNGINEDNSNSNKTIIKVNGTEYQKLELIGKGGSSKVYKVKKATNNKVYAIKEVTLEEFDESSINGFKGEVDLLLKLRESRRVVRLIDYSMNEKQTLLLVMECGDIDLAHVLTNTASSKNGGFFEQEDIDAVRFYSKEILRCVCEVHDNDIVHSDLKPANFLFVKGILKLIDFGISNAVPDHTVNIYRDSQFGTPNYMAPEALINLPNKDNSWKVGKPSDVWSCGCIIYQMVYGKPPYGHIQGNQRLLAIMNPEFEIKFPEWNVSHKFKIPRSLIQLLKSCLMRDPMRRATIHQLLEKNQFLNPKVITKELLRDLIGSAIKHGAENGMVSNEEIHGLSSDIWEKLDHLNY